MSTYLNDLARSFHEEKERRLFRIVYEAVQDGMWPWDPGRIAMYRTDELDPQVAIRIERFPDLVFKSKPDYFLTDETRMVVSLAEKAFKFYRYREALPVDDHIILGEE